MLLAFSTPIDSILSEVSLIPAVSINLNLIPLIVVTSSIASLVVPGILETIALSSLTIAFKSEDLPALGFPAIVTVTPSLITLPNEKDSMRLDNLLSNSFNSDFN